MRKQQVLFLCTANSARSQMAEGLLRQFGSERFDVYSAGMQPKGVHPLALRVMDELGIDLRSHSSKSVDKFMGRHFDYIVTVCDSARETCPLFPSAGRLLHWSFEDPAAIQGSEEDRLHVFRKVRDQLAAHIREQFARS